jgi:hypothetical protein
MLLVVIVLLKSIHSEGLMFLGDKLYSIGREGERDRLHRVRVDRDLLRRRAVRRFYDGSIQKTFQVDANFSLYRVNHLLYLARTALPPGEHYKKSSKELPRHFEHTP